jgi:pimeloyl-ACP methyl ester carboxylesterase
MIGYRQLGLGPGVLLIHGGMQAAQNLMKLAEYLSADFKVYVPDRRGRGLSGEYGDTHGMKNECEDIGALLRGTGSHNLFGLSAGALISLEAARLFPAIRKLAIYEPPLPVNDSDPNPVAWLPHFDECVARGELGAAMITAALGTESLESPILKLVPHALLVRLMSLALKGEKVKNGDVPLRKIIPTMHYDAIAVNDMEGTLASFGTVNAEVLLLGGTKSPRYLKLALDALEGTLPHVRRVEFQGVGHLAADNSGKPNIVARELRKFFAGSENAQ